MPAQRVLVIGSTGFAGGHFVAQARSGGFEVVTAARKPGAADHEVNLLVPDSLRRAIVGSDAGAVVNLAGAASVSRSWVAPEATFEVNATGTLNLLEAVAAEAPEAHVVCVSSGEVYGGVDDAQLPLREDAQVAPVNPYPRARWRWSWSAVSTREPTACGSR